MIDPEAEAVLNVMRGVVSGAPESSGITGAGAADPVDWDRLANHAAKTRVESAMSRAISLADGVPQWLWESWLASRHFVRASQQQLGSVLSQIGAEFEHRGVRAVVRKGPHCASLYPSADCRPYGDIDLLIDRADSKGVSEALERLGFGHGLLDATGRIQEFGAQAAAFFQVGTGSLPTSVRNAGDDDPLPVVVVDAAWDWLPPRARIATDVSTTEAVETSYAWDGSPLPVLRPAFALFDWCCNLYLSSVSLYYVSKQKFRRLCPYVDVLLMARDPRLDRDEFWGIVEKPRARTPVVFALASAERVFPGHLPPDLSEWSFRALSDAGIDLDVVGQLDGTPSPFPPLPDRVFTSEFPPIPSARVKF